MSEVLSGSYLEELEDQYKKDPQSVSPQWRRVLSLGEESRHGAPHKVGGLLDADDVTTSVQLDPLQLAEPLLCRLATKGTAWQIDHLQRDRCAWLEEHFKTRKVHTPMSEHECQHVFYKAYAFENFLHRTYPGVKRFGLEGGEMLVVVLEMLVRHSVLQEVKDIVWGMAHRGRLCVLAGVFEQPLEELFRQFAGHSLHAMDGSFGSGDVKYHMGYSCDRVVLGYPVHLSLLPNPSHLEAVFPVVLGKVRSKQNLNQSPHSVLGVVVHGDAAFAGQGVVMEALQLARLPGYRTGGTVHIVLDNQIGFTTNPWEGRSTPLPTDIAKMMDIPVWHVRSDSPLDEILHVVDAALEYRRTFASDVVLRWVCYRRYGHNEGDEPSYSQPVMYRAIAQTKDMPIDVPDAIKQEVDRALQDAWQYAENHTITCEPNWFRGAWEHMKSPFELLPDRQSLSAQGNAPSGHLLIYENTGITHDSWKTITEAMHNVPDGFSLHPKLLKWFQVRRNSMEEGRRISWSTAEAAALGSLLLEGRMVRLSGQDVARGTFTQRHAALWDHQTGAPWIGLEGLGQFELVNSPLSEVAALGFEYGYSTTSPNALVLWEAQFGDFANVSQVIIDQFIASSCEKWLRLSGIVLLLPHGLEGQGPEHSSARMERFMELSADNNWRIANCTTPANYFHLLRSQMQGPYRQPLIVMTPKSLLRHKRCVSTWSDFETGTHFSPVLWDPFVPLKVAHRIIVCQGKVYYDLLECRDTMQAYNVSVVRLEQLYPLPDIDLPPDATLVWCQEEPQNMGLWPFLCRQKHHTWRRMHYAGRRMCACPATGSASRHREEQQALLHEAIQGVFQ